MPPEPISRINVKRPTRVVCTTTRASSVMLSFATEASMVAAGVCRGLASSVRPRAAKKVFSCIVMSVV